MFKRLIPGKMNHDNIASPKYFLNVGKEDSSAAHKFLKAIERMNLVFVTKEKIGPSIEIDVEISFDEKTCVCIPKEHVLGVVTGKEETVMSFSDRVLIIKENGLLIAIHIGGANEEGTSA